MATKWDTALEGARGLPCPVLIGSMRVSPPRGLPDRIRRSAPWQNVINGRVAAADHWPAEEGSRGSCVRVLGRRVFFGLSHIHSCRFQGHCRFARAAHDSADAAVFSHVLSRTKAAAWFDALPAQQAKAVMKALAA